VSAEVARKVMRSPVTGLKMVSPVRIIVAASFSSLTPRRLGPRRFVFVGAESDLASSDRAIL
jgi:hypothetical protein